MTAYLITELQYQYCLHTSINAFLKPALGDQHHCVLPPCFGISVISYFHVFKGLFFSLAQQWPESQLGSLRLCVSLLS